MPYVQVIIAHKLEEQQKIALKESLGALISLIPGKTEQGLMISIEDGATMYFRGTAENCAYVTVNLFLSTFAEKKRDFAQAFSKALSEIAGIEPRNLYMTFAEYSNWFSNGDLK